MNSDGNSFVARLGAIAKEAGGGAALARSCNIPQTTMAGYVSGKSEPRASDILKIANAAQVRIEWLLTGDGSARGESATGPRGAFSTDARLIGRLTEGIARVFKEEGQGAALHQIAERAAMYHDRIVASTSDPDERLMEAGAALAELRQELRRAAENPNETKRLA